MNEKYLEEALKFFDVDRDINKAELRSLYKRKAKIVHPDKGGTEEEFVKLTEMYSFILFYIENRDEYKSRTEEEYSGEDSKHYDEKSAKENYSDFSENDDNYYSNSIISELNEILLNLNLSKSETTTFINSNMSMIIFYVENKIFNTDDKLEIYEYLAQNTGISSEDVKRGYKKYNKKISKQYLFVRKYTILFFISLTFTMASLISFNDAFTSSYIDTYYWFPIQILIFLILTVLKLFWLPSFIWFIRHKLNIRKKSLPQILKKKKRIELRYLIIVTFLTMCILIVSRAILIELDVLSPHYDSSFYDSSNLISAPELLSEIDIDGLSVNYIGKIKTIEEERNKVLIEVGRPYLFPGELGNNYVSQPLVLEIDVKTKAYTQYLSSNLDEGDFINFKGVITGGTSADEIRSNIIKINVLEINKLNEQEALTPTLETYYADESFLINGIEFSDLQIELSQLETRVKVNVINNTDQPFVWDPFNSLLYVDGTEYTFGADYMPSEPYDVPNLILSPGQSSEGTIQFPAINSSGEHEISWNPNIQY